MEASVSRPPHPIDTVPVFVRAGAILPLGSPVESTAEKQTITEVRVYPGADGNFVLYDDDGTTYAYEHGDYRTTSLALERPRSAP